MFAAIYVYIQIITFLYHYCYHCGCTELKTAYKANDRDSVVLVLLKKS